MGGDGARPTHLIKLSSVEDDGLGEELNVIWELEPGTQVHEKSTLPDPDSFDCWRRLNIDHLGVSFRSAATDMATKLNIEFYEDARDALHEALLD